MNGKIVFRIVSALVLVAAIAGIAFFAFNAGVAQGSPVTIQAPEGQSAQAPYPSFGYGMPFHRPFGMMGFGCFGPLIALFLFFLAMKAFRFMFWGPRCASGMHGHGPWRGRWDGNGLPPMFAEWHKRAHEAPAEDKKE
jgi:hypothetical protein